MNVPGRKNGDGRQADLSVLVGLGGAGRRLSTALRKGCGGGHAAAVSRKADRNEGGHAPAPQPITTGQPPNSTARHIRARERQCCSISNLFLILNPSGRATNLQPKLALFTASFPITRSPTGPLLRANPHGFWRQLCHRCCMQSRTRPLPTSITRKRGFKQTTQNYSCMCTFPLPIPIHPSQEEPPNNQQERRSASREKFKRCPSSRPAPWMPSAWNSETMEKRSRERRGWASSRNENTQSHRPRLGLRNKDPPPKTPVLLCKCRSKYSRGGGSRSHSSIVR